MIRTIKVELSAAFPGVPLPPVDPYEGSAASMTILGVPRDHAKRKITGLTVTVSATVGQTRAYTAIRQGSAYEVTIPATAFGAPGTVLNGVIFAASGIDENEQPVGQWILGVADLEVRRSDGTVAPGVVRTNCVWFDSVPAHPSKGNIAIIDGSVSIFDGSHWVECGGGGGGGGGSARDFVMIGAIMEPFDLDAFDWQHHYKFMYVYFGGQIVTTDGAIIVNGSITQAWGASDPSSFVTVEKCDNNGTPMYIVEKVI